MLEVCRFKPGIPFLAVVHVDETGRPQVLKQKAGPQLYRLLEMFYERTGVPMLINTSFNVMGEPIVETSLDALRALLFTGIDAVYVEGRLFTKEPAYTGVESLVAAPNCECRSEGHTTVMICETEHGR